MGSQYQEYEGNAVDVIERERSTHTEFECIKKKYEFGLFSIVSAAFYLWQYSIFLESDLYILLVKYNQNVYGMCVCVSECISLTRCFFLFGLLEAAAFHLSLMFHVDGRVIIRSCFDWKRWRAVMSGGVRHAVWGVAAAAVMSFYFISHCVQCSNFGLQGLFTFE